MKKLKIASLLLASLLLAGCGSAEEQTSSAGGTTSEEPASSEKIEYERWTKDAPDIDSFNRTYEKVASDSLYVEKADVITDSNFIMGMDVSSIISLENSGVKFYDFDGNEADLLKVLSDNGVNYIRVRVWNDPYDSEGHGYGGGNNDVATAVEIGKRAAAYNMSLLVDFHYSDFWADPSKQMAPKAWDPDDMDQMGQDLYDFTCESLKQIEAGGAKVGMVQVGNETNSGHMAGVVTWQKFRTLFNQGAKAVRDTCPDALVACHFTNPEKTENILDYAARIASCDYDVFGTSYYPYWHGTLENLSNVLSQIGTEYNKYTMVMETSYCHDSENTDFWGNTIGETSGYDDKFYPFTEAGQSNAMNKLIKTVAEDTTNGIGVCYWEGAWIPVGTTSWEENSKLWEQYGSGWASSYSASYDPDDAGKYYGGSAVENQAFFDATGHPYESLKVFNLSRFGNEDVELYADGVEDANISFYTNETITLPSTVNIIYNNNDTKAEPVTWDSTYTAEKLESLKSNGNGKYDIEGTVLGQKVYCHLTIMEYNYLENYSFETGDYDPWEMNTSATLSGTHIVKVTNENPQTGTYAAHFWTSEASGVDFTLTQKVSITEAGTYKLQASFLGGGQGSNALSASNQTVYITIVQNGNEIKKQSHTITKYNDGYSDCLLEGVSVAAGEATVKINVKIAEANCWGDIDDVMLNRTGA